jgi:uncharacterized protein
VTAPLLKPALYGVAADGSLTLFGGRCRCGHTFFPMQTYGCERCGSAGEALTPLALAGRGRLATAVTVHMHDDSRRAPPFVVGVIALDDGPVVRTLLTEPTVMDPDEPTRVEAVLAPALTPDGGEALDLRFKPVARSAR